MTFDELIQLQVLQLKAAASGVQPMAGGTVDQLIEAGTYPVEMRQMCAKVSPQLYQALDEICSALDMSKRQFIEFAVSDAISRAQGLLAEHKIFGTQGVL